jgi:hypothetical protein
MIVIVAIGDDPTAGAVAEALGRLGRKDVLWLDLETAFEKIILNFRADGAGKVRWTIQSRENPELVADRESVTAVYWRRPVKVHGSPFLGIPKPENLDALEVFWSVRWILESLPPEFYPLNHPYIFARAENKHRQLAAALEVGFAIPATCHSNQPSLLSEFIVAQPAVAVKAMRMPAVSDTGLTDEVRHIACKSFSPSFLVDRLKKVERTQLYCQQAIPRQRDLRIMVFPHETIAAEIDTSRLPDNKLDWREDSIDRAHRIVSIAPEFDRQLREFLARMELKAGYFDFAQPDDGPPVFFECNTNAGWLWIEQVTGHPIADTIARELVHPV